MSRSYKKNPFATDHSRGTKYMKRLANHKVRRVIKNSEDLPSKLKHKKMTESWNICDYKWYSTEKDAIDWYINKCNNKYIRGKYPTLETYLNYWAKCTIRK